MTVPNAVVIGVGRIGAVTVIGLAHLGVDVTGVDRSADRVAELADGRLTEHEPGLRSALTAALRFRSVTFARTARPGAYDLAFLCVDTPPLPTGEPDLRQVLGAASDAVPLLRPHGVLVTRSTVPVGTGDRIEAALRNAGRADVAVVHVPEFLREGRAWEDFREPDRVVIGGDCPVAVEQVRSVFARLDRPVICTDRRTAEIAKYAANAFLATSISFANEMSDLCAATGSDAGAVFHILRADRRIGAQAYLTPGLGFGGHCLPKDTAALEDTAARHGEDGSLIHAVRRVNATRVYRVVAQLRRALGSLPGRVVCLAGLAFKPDTDDLRESPSLHLGRLLAHEGVHVRGWDPHVRGDLEHINVCGTLTEAAEGADALVIAHGWRGWREVDPLDLRRMMRGGVLIDAPGVVDLDLWTAAGFDAGRNAAAPRVDVHR